MHLFQVDLGLNKIYLMLYENGEISQRYDRISALFPLPILMIPFKILQKDFFQDAWITSFDFSRALLTENPKIEKVISPSFMGEFVMKNKLE